MGLCTKCIFCLTICLQYDKTFSKNVKCDADVISLYNVLPCIDHFEERKEDEDDNGLSHREYYAERKLRQLIKEYSYYKQAEVGIYPCVFNALR